MARTTHPALSPPMRRLLDAIERGARLRLAGWQEIAVTFEPGHPENYVAREATLLALRKRGLIVADADGVRVAQ